MVKEKEEQTWMDSGPLMFIFEKKHAFLNLCLTDGRRAGGQTFDIVCPCWCCWWWWVGWLFVLECSLAWFLERMHGFIPPVPACLPAVLVLPARGDDLPQAFLHTPHTHFYPTHTFAHPLL